MLNKLNTNSPSRKPKNLKQKDIFKQIKHLYKEEALTVAKNLVNTSANNNSTINTTIAAVCNDVQKQLIQGKVNDEFLEKQISTLNAALLKENGDVSNSRDKTSRFLVALFLIFSKQTNPWWDKLLRKTKTNKTRDFINWCNKTHQNNDSAAPATLPIKPSLISSDDPQIIQIATTLKKVGDIYIQCNAILEAVKLHIKLENSFIYPDRGNNIKIQLQIVETKSTIYGKQCVFTLVETNRQSMLSQHNDESNTDTNDPFLDSRAIGSEKSTKINNQITLNKGQLAYAALIIANKTDINSVRRHFAKDCLTDAYYSKYTNKEEVLTFIQTNKLLLPNQQKLILAFLGEDESNDQQSQPLNVTQKTQGDEDNSLPPEVKKVIATYFLRKNSDENDDEYQNRRSGRLSHINTHYIINSSNNQEDKEDNFYTTFAIASANFFEEINAGTRSNQKNAVNKKLYQVNYDSAEEVVGHPLSIVHTNKQTYSPTQPVMDNAKLYNYHEHTYCKVEESFSLTRKSHITTMSFEREGYNTLSSYAEKNNPDAVKDYNNPSQSNETQLPDEEAASSYNNNNENHKHALGIHLNKFTITTKNTCHNSSLQITTAGSYKVNDKYHIDDAVRVIQEGTSKDTLAIIDFRILKGISMLKKDMKLYTIDLAVWQAALKKVNNERDQAMTHGPTWVNSYKSSIFASPKENNQTGLFSLIELFDKLFAPQDLEYSSEPQDSLQPHLQQLREVKDQQELTRIYKRYKPIKDKLARLISNPDSFTYQGTGALITALALNLATQINSTYDKQIIAPFIRCMSGKDRTVALFYTSYILNSFIEIELNEMETEDTAATNSPRQPNLDFINNKGELQEKHFRNSPDKLNFLLTLLHDVTAANLGSVSAIGEYNNKNLDYIKNRCKKLTAIQRDGKFPVSEALTTLSARIQTSA